jgi:heat shock protein HtpX
MGSFLNGFKTAMLLAILTALLLWAGSFFGGTTGLVIAFVFVLLMNLASFWWSHKIVLWMYNAKELPKNDKITKMVHDLARKDGLPPPRVYLMENATPNAFATGPTYTRAAVAVTSSIIALLDEQELKGVIAHELTHVKNRDTLIQTIAAVIAGVISYLGVMARWGAIFGGGDEENGGGLLQLLVLGIVAPLAAMILQLALSRTREYAADEGSARL